MSNDLKALLACIGTIVTIYATTLVMLYFSLSIKAAFNPSAWVGLIYMLIGFVALSAIGMIVGIATLSSGAVPTNNMKA